jgi:serine/threonine protein phosphatase 1
MSRVLAIGDIHGCDAALATLLEWMAVTTVDTVVVLGDIVDRGPQSKQAVERVLGLRERCKLVFLLGNHEEMLFNALAGDLAGPWLRAGGRQTLDSYGGSLDDIPPSHLRFLRSGQSFWETETEIFIHASLEPDVSLVNQTADYLRWKRLGGSERPHISGKRVICGHSSQQDGYPLVFDGWACIDTYAHGGGWLSCLDVAADHLYQASQTGATRDFPLSRFA